MFDKYVLVIGAFSYERFEWLETENYPVENELHNSVGSPEKLNSSETKINWWYMTLDNINYSRGSGIFLA